jgi:two-component system NtrC family sensor kinase
MKSKPKRGDTGPRDAVRLSRESDAAPLLVQGSAPHARVPGEVPAAWLDRLLAATLDLPLAQGPRAIAESLVDALAFILPTYAVGACVVPDEAPHVARARRPARGAPGGEASGQEPVVVTRLPEGAGPPGPGIDPTRLFPGFLHEHVVAVPGGSMGSTLHLASYDDAFDRDGSPPVHLLERAAGVLARALATARDMGIPRDPAGLEERMIQADKLATFGQIAAGIVHELNNPLTSIVAYSDYLIRKAVSLGTPADPEDVDRLRRISDSANRMLRFTRDFVAYARPSSGAPGPVVVHGVIDQATAFCEHVLAAAGMTVEKRYGAEVLTVRGVSEQLVQVFVNLLTNASQAAAGAGARVAITTSLDPSTRRVQVWVEDNGVGIAADHLRQVFLPFFTTKAKRDGTGLGLSIVKSILEAHDGDIRVESAPGRGARFLLELPAWQRP